LYSERKFEGYISAGSSIVGKILLNIFEHKLLPKAEDVFTQEIIKSEISYAV
jgi:hypothetical protein